MGLPGQATTPTPTPPGASRRWDVGERNNPSSPVEPLIERIQLIQHSGLKLRLQVRIGELQALLNRDSFWARGRSHEDLRRMVAGSQAVVSAWRGSNLVGFGRATTDGVFRAVLWDVVVAAEHQGHGLGSELVAMLLRHRLVARAERVYLMTTNSAGFYTKLKFHEHHGQKLMIRESEIS